MVDEEEERDEGRTKTGDGRRKRREQIEKEGVNQG
jgi:hypothetical protein